MFYSTTKKFRVVFNYLKVVKNALFLFRLSFVCESKNQIVHQCKGRRISLVWAKLLALQRRRPLQVLQGCANNGRVTQGPVIICCLINSHK